MYEVSLRKITKDYYRYTIVLIVGLIIIAYAIYRGINIKAINNNTTNYVKVDNYEKTREDFLFGSYKYKIKYYYKINNNDYMCEKNFLSKYWKPEKSEEVYIKDFNHPEKCMDDDSLGLYAISIYPLLLVGGLFVALSLVNYKPAKSQLKDAKYLINNGVLVKNAPYYRNIIGRRKNGDPIISTIIHVKSPSGAYIRFSSTHGIVNFLAKGGTVDIIYDPDNCENYYAAKEINRIGGNQESDYQQSTKEELEMLRRCNLEYGEVIYYRNKKTVEKIIEVIKRYKI